MIQRKKLSNGMEILFEKRETSTISLAIANRFGASSETEKIKGIAHFIEHLVFTGTKTRTHEQISREIEKKGGILNAFTSHDVTAFFFKLPSKHIKTGLEILTDILTKPAFEKTKFEKEKKVIIEEIKMYHDSPQRNVMDKIEADLYESPFGKGIAGSEETVSSLDNDFVKKHFEKNYTTNNLFVVAIGNAKFDELCDWFEKNFPKKEAEIKIPEIKKINKTSKEERQGIDQAHLTFAFHAPKKNEKEYYALEVLDAYLAKGMSSKLFLKIREEKGLAYAVKSSISTEKTHSYYVIYVGTTKQAVNEVKEIIKEEIKNISNLNEKDIEEAKEKLLGLYDISQEESLTVMQELIFAEIANKAEDFYDYREKIKSITLDQVKKLANINKFSIAEIVPA